MEPSLPQLFSDPGTKREPFSWEDHDWWGSHQKSQKGATEQLSFQRGPESSTLGGGAEDSASAPHGEEHVEGEHARQSGQGHPVPVARLSGRLAFCGSKKMAYLKVEWAIHRVFFFAAQTGFGAIDGLPWFGRQAVASLSENQECDKWGRILSPLLR